MPQPESSRSRAQDIHYNATDRPWPVDPAAPRGAGPRRVPPRTDPKDPKQDGRTGEDKDGNEQLAEELDRKKEPASSRRTSTDRQEAMNRVRCDLETEDTGEWVATERFTLDDELEDTWPNVPARYLEE